MTKARNAKPGSAQAVERILQKLADVGILTLPTGSPAGDSLSEQARQKLADDLGRVPGKLLSEIIMEERG